MRLSLRRSGSCPAGAGVRFAHDVGPLRGENYSAEPLREAPAGQLPLLLSMVSGGELRRLSACNCMGLRVRWQLAAKGAAVVLVAFVALQLVPALLRPPAPEPLPADVGLPRVVAAPLPVAEPETPKPVKKLPKSKPNQHPRRQPAHEVRPAPPPNSKAPPIPSPAPEPPPAPAAPEASIPPDDGSAEFAPH